jgi:hypothetical protein
LANLRNADLSGAKGLTLAQGLDEACGSDATLSQALTLKPCPPDMPRWATYHNARRAANVRCARDLHPPVARWFPGSFINCIEIQPAVARMAHPADAIPGGK